MNQLLLCRSGRSGTRALPRSSAAESPACAQTNADGGRCVASKSGGDELQWLVTVDAGATAVIPFGFSVSWPTGKYVHGLVG